MFGLLQSDDILEQNCGASGRIPLYSPLIGHDIETTFSVPIMLINGKELLSEPFLSLILLPLLKGIMMIFERIMRFVHVILLSLIFLHKIF